MLIYICDDSQSDRTRLLYHLNKFMEETGSVFSVRWFASADIMLTEYGKTDEKPEIIFLDIYMSGTNGMSAAEKLNSLGCKNGIVFTTSSDSHALNAFRVNADGYLLKPYTYADFKRTMERFSDAFAMTRKTITVSFNREETKIPLKSIRFIESYNHCTYFYTGDREYKSVKPISEFHTLLQDDSDFISCGKSNIINLRYVTDCADGSITLDNGTQIQIPVRIRKNIEREVSRFMQREPEPLS